MYITFDDLYGRYPEVKTWRDDFKTVNSHMIYYAEIELNSMLAPAYSVPFSAAHPTVKDLAIELTYAKFNPDTERQPDLYTAIKERIERIKEGEEYIYSGSGTVIAGDVAASNFWSNTEDYHPVFSTLDYESEYTIVDSGRQYDEENKRS